ncbi:Chaperone SurA [Gammaproteobacteria bacterium]
MSIHCCLYRPFCLLILSLGMAFSSLNVTAGGVMEKKISSPSSVRPLDTIVALVNDDVVVRSELDAQVKLALSELKTRQTPLPPQALLERQVLDALINTRLQLQIAEQSGIKVDEPTLNRAIEGIAARNRVSLEGLRKALEADGVPFKVFQDDTRRQIVLNRLREQQVISRIQIADQEIEAFLETSRQGAGQPSEVRLSHILIAVPEGADSETLRKAKAKAEGLVAQLRGGAHFEQLAATYSNDRNALQGGDLGWRSVSEVPTVAQELINSLQRGQVSDPIRSPNGFHILRLTDVRRAERPLVNQTRVRHILAKTSDLVSDEDARHRLDQLRARILAGEDFAALARAQSEDGGSSLRGGELGWVSPGDLLPAFEHEMANLKPGEISGAFRTQFGWHIAQVLERRAREGSPESLRNQAREALVTRKSSEAVQLWLQRLRDEAYVVIKLETSP